MGEGRRRGSRPSNSTASTVASPPNRMVSSNAMITKGAYDTGCLPPVTSDQTREDQMLRRNPVAVPVRPPISVNSRTFDSGRTRSTSSSISSTGTGV